MFNFEQLEKNSLQSLQEAYDEALYCHNKQFGLDMKVISPYYSFL